LNGGRVVKAGVATIGDYIFTVEPRETPGGRRKIACRLVLPVVQQKTENGVSSYVVVRVARAMVEFDLSNDSTDQEIKDLVGMLQSSLDPSKTLVNNVVIGRENVF